MYSDEKEIRCLNLKLSKLSVLPVNLYKENTHLINVVTFRDFKKKYY